MAKSWDRYSLGRKDIFYDEVVYLYPIGYLPVHVESLRNSMLDFTCAILDFDEELWAVGLDQLKPSECSPHLLSAQKTFRKAASISQGGYAEKTWEAFFQTHFFDPLVESVSVAREDSRRISRCHYYYDAIRRETNELWNLFDTPSTTPGLEPFQSLKCPKPDQAFYLPIYHTESRPAIPTIIDSDARRWDRAANDGITEPFSWATLKKLFASGLRPTPFKIFDNDPKEANLKCFPWLIVEHKKESTGKEQVCCQAANAGACAVRLNRISARYALELPHGAHIPPIPTVTTVGPLVTVWIVYYARYFDAPSTGKYVYDVTTKLRKEGYIMKAIWEGDMTKLSDIIKFQMILENTHTWAMRVFRPLMASYITQWKSVHGPRGGDSAIRRRQEAVDRSLTVFPIVKRLLDLHSGMELDDREHAKVTPLLLGLLMQQICASEREFLSSEVDRVVMEKLQTLNLSSRTSRAEDEPTRQASDATYAHPTIESEPVHEASQAPPQFTFDARSSVLSPSPTINNDDPGDNDYKPSQYTATVDPSDDEAASVADSLGAASSVASFAETDSTLWRSPGYTPRRSPLTPRARASRSRVKKRHRQSTPRSARATTSSDDLTPRGNGFKSRLFTNDETAASPGPGWQSLSTQSDPQGPVTRSPVSPKSQLQQSRPTGDDIEWPWLRTSLSSHFSANYFSMPGSSSSGKSPMGPTLATFGSLPSLSTNPFERKPSPCAERASRNATRIHGQSDDDADMCGDSQTHIDLTGDDQGAP